MRTRKPTNWHLHAHPFRGPREPRGQGRAGTPAWLKTTVAGGPGATVCVLRPARGRARRAAPKPAPPAAPEPHRAALAAALRETGSRASPAGLGRGRSARPYPTCVRAPVRGCRRAGHRPGRPSRAGEGRACGLRRPRQTRDPRGAGAVLPELGSPGPAPPPHAAASGPPRLSDARAPQAHGGQPGAPQLPLDLPSAPRPPSGDPRRSPAAAQTPDTDTRHRPPAGPRRRGPWGAACRPGRPPPAPLTAAPSARPLQHPPTPCVLSPLSAPRPLPRHLPVQGPALPSEGDRSSTTSTWAARSCRGRRGGRARQRRRRAARAGGQTPRPRCWPTVSLSSSPPAPPRPRPACGSG